jgi:putative endonuclease
MSRERVVFGKTGEDLACGELERRGYAVLARRYRIRGAELDIVARDGPTLVFVEVKARDGRDFGDAAEAVTWRKRQRIVAAARHYMMTHRLHECPCRFDVVSVHVENETPHIEIYQNAFLAS